MDHFNDTDVRTANVHEMPADAFEALEARYVATHALTESDYEAMDRLSHGEQRVSVKGKRFVAEARVAGGRWVKAGIWPTEAQAWIAAEQKAADLTGNQSSAA